MFYFSSQNSEHSRKSYTTETAYRETIIVFCLIALSLASSPSGCGSVRYKDILERQRDKKKNHNTLFVFSFFAVRSSLISDSYRKKKCTYAYIKITIK